MIMSDSQSTANSHNDANEVSSSPAKSRFDRRTFIAGGLATAGLLTASAVVQRFRKKTPVFIAKDQKYDGDLVTTIRDGLASCGLDPVSLKGKRVLLKPNMVEPSRNIPHMTTHPSVILSAAKVFRDWGAEVTVGEGPGHVRDTEMALIESGVGEALESESLIYKDLNYEEVRWQENKGKSCKLKGFYFPRSVMEADLVVSMPKMKTHHWMGVTASMKNLYGVIPGIKYGWPKNVLHHNGIPNTVFDINASLPKTIAIVDGITCMEGDGPIMGTPKEMGLLVMGTTPIAVDATVCRLMNVLPERIAYMKLANNALGPTQERLIEQRGENWEPLSSTFQLLDLPHLRQLRGSKEGILVS